MNKEKIEKVKKILSNKKFVMKLFAVFLLVGFMFAFMASFTRNMSEVVADVFVLWAQVFIGIAIGMFAIILFFTDKNKDKKPKKKANK